MTQENLIMETRASSEAVGAIANRIEAALEGEDSGLVMLAMLSLIVILQKPSISPEGLQQVIQDASRFICLSLDGVDVVPVGMGGKDIRVN